MKTSILCVIIVLVLAVDNQALQHNVGEFKNVQHGVGGTVYITDEHTLLIKGFTYDGLGPDAFFWAGTDGNPSSVGTILPYPFENKFYAYEDKQAPIIEGRFNGNIDITLKTPNSLKTTDIKWLSVWCREYTVNFGSFHFNTTGINLASDSNAEPESESESEPETKPEQSLEAVNNHLDNDFETAPAKSEPESEPETEGEPESEANPETAPILGYGSASPITYTMMALVANLCFIMIFL